LPESFPGPLTPLALAIALLFYTGIWNKQTLTMRTSTWWFHGFPPQGNHKPIPTTLGRKPADGPKKGQSQPLSLYLMLDPITKNRKEKKQTRRTLPKEQIEEHPQHNHTRTIIAHMGIREEFRRERQNGRKCRRRRETNARGKNADVSVLALIVFVMISGPTFG
jgi:hypothetical protein